MAEGARKRVPFRRRRTGRTDYRRRLKLLRSGEVRAVVRKSLNQTVVQLVRYQEAGDRVLASAVSGELKAFGWTGATGNVPAAYLTGVLAGRRAKAGAIASAVLDLGIQRPARGGRLFAAARGLVDAGVAIPHGEDVFPADERVRGAHLGDARAAEVAAVKAKVEAA